MTADDADLLAPDICVIGGGSGGLTVAAAAAAFGVSVVLVEKGLMGGDCLNYGCVPSKALLAAAGHAQAMRDGAAFGIAPVEPQVDFARVRQHVRNVVASIAPNDSAERFEGLGVRVIKAAARFTDKRTIEAGAHRIRARRFVIATGSSPAIPPIPGLDGVAFHTNESIFELGERPVHLAIIGGGPIGIELAQAFRRLGSAVSVFEAGAALGREDPVTSRIVLDRLRAEGVAIHEQTKVARVEAGEDGGIAVHVDGGEGVARVGATHLLVAAGRRVNTAGLGLEAAGIAFTGKGVTVGPSLRTTNARVYAVGDIAGGPQFTHAATYQASLVVRQILFRLPARQRPAIVPRVTYTDPELAAVGLGPSEADAKAAKVLSWPLSKNDRAETERRTEGMIRIVAGRRGTILGVSIVAPHAGEMIHLWADAVARRATVRDMLAYVPPYPTTGEIGRRAALTWYDGAAMGGAVQRLLAVLRRFG